MSPERSREACIVLVAEQIVVDCSMQRLVDLLRHRPVDWLMPLLRLAGDEGEAGGLAVLGERAESREVRAPPGAAGSRHRVEVGEPTDEHGTFRAGLHWWTTGYRVLFAELDGAIEIRALQGHSVLGVEGACTGAESLATRRAAESAVRSLLGHLRSAVEASPLSAR